MAAVATFEELISRAETERDEITTRRVPSFEELAGPEPGQQPATINRYAVGGMGGFAPGITRETAPYIETHPIEAIKEIPGALAAGTERGFGAVGTAIQYAGDAMKAQRMPSVVPKGPGGFFIDSVQAVRMIADKTGFAGGVKLYDKTSDTLTKSGKYIADYWDEQASKGWEAPDPELMEEKWNRPLQYGARVTMESAPTFFAAIGAGYATKSPNVSLAMMGAYEKMNSYRVQREMGAGFDKADFISTMSGTWEAVTEKIPFDFILKGGGKSRLMKAIAGGGLESIQELLAGMGQNYLEYFGYEAKDWESVPGAIKEGMKHTLDNWLESVVAGGVLGGGASTVIPGRGMLPPKVGTTAVRGVPRETGPETDIKERIPHISEMPLPSVPTEKQPQPPVVKEVKAKKPEVGKPVEPLKPPVPVSKVAKEPIVKPAPVKPPSEAPVGKETGRVEAKKPWEMTRDEHMTAFGQITLGATKKEIKDEILTKLASAKKEYDAALESGKPRVTSRAKRHLDAMELHAEMIMRGEVPAPYLWGDRAYMRTMQQHKKIVKEAIEQGKPVPREVLEEYKSEKWAKEALVEPTITPVEGEKVISSRKSPDERRKEMKEAGLTASQREEIVAKERTDLLSELEQKLEVGDVIEVKDLSGDRAKKRRYVLMESDKAGKFLKEIDKNNKPITTFGSEIIFEKGGLIGPLWQGATKTEKLTVYGTSIFETTTLAKAEPTITPVEGELLPEKVWERLTTKEKEAILKSGKTKEQFTKEFVEYDKKAKAEIEAERSKPEAIREREVSKLADELEPVAHMVDGAIVSYEQAKLKGGEGQLSPDVVTMGFRDKSGKLYSNQEGKEILKEAMVNLKKRREELKTTLTEYLEKVTPAKPEVKPVEKVVAKAPITKAEKNALRDKGYKLSQILKMKPAEARGLLEGEKDVTEEKETITEPKPGIEEQQRQARPTVSLKPTGKLDPTNPEEAGKIIEEHRNFLGARETQMAHSGIYETEWDKEAQENIISKVIYSHEQVDQAYRTLQTEIESPQDDVSLFAMPGKEKELGAIGAKMAKMKKLSKKKRQPSIGKARQLPKAKTKKEDFVKAVHIASAREDSKYAMSGVYVEGENLIASDGRRLFIAKGKWGKDGLYKNPTFLKQGLLVKADKTGQKFPAWKDIVPDYSKEKAITIGPTALNNDLPTVWRRLHQAASMTTEESPGVIVILNKDGSLGFATAAPEVGHVEINVNPGGKILGAINSSFLIDALQFHAIRGDRLINFYFPYPDRPLLTVSSHNETKTLTMPIGIAEPSKELQEAIAEEKPKPKGGGARPSGFLGIPIDIPGPGILREGAERIYQNFINRFASIENITKKAQKLGMVIQPGENPGLRARGYLGLGRKVESILHKNTFRITPEGEIEITGEGLRPVLDSFDKSFKKFESKRRIRESVFKKYLIAMRTVEDLQRPAYEGAKRNIASKVEVETAKKQLATIVEKYGLNSTKVLNDAAERLYEFQKRVLHLLVDSGNMSQEQFDKIVKLNRHYIPFDRILEDDFGGGVPVSKKRFTEARSPIRKIKGSKLDIHDPIESVIKNTFKIADIAERNTVSRGVAKLGKVLPAEVSPVHIKMFPIKVDPKEILTIAKEFRSKSAKVVKEVKKIRTEDGEGADVSGPIAKLEKVVKDALTHRGFSEGESNAFVAQIRKGKPAEGDEPTHTTETIRQIIKETQQVIISKEPVESTIFRPSQFKPKGRVIEYFDKGKRKYVELPQNVYDATTGMNEAGSNILIQVFAKPAHWLRVGATITPEFILRNPIRDQYTALMQSSFGFIPFVDSMGAIASVLGKTQDYHDWLRSGGAYSGFVELNRPALSKAVLELNSTKGRILLRKLNVIATAQDVSQLMEQATRLAVFKSARYRRGMTAVEAGFQSREATIDFARRGSKMRDVNQLMAFFNAGIQGLDKTIRHSITHPYSTAIKGIAAITIPTLLLYLRNRDDDEYKELSQWKKDLFWNIKIGDTWWRVPKPFLYGQIYGSLVERFIEYIDTKDPKAFKDLKKSMYDAVSPVSGDPESGLLITAIKPIIENAVNRNFFLQRPIVPKSVEDMTAPEQYGRYTSETAKQLGKWLNYSPAKIENLIRGYFGGTGRYALEGSDFLVNAIRREMGKKITQKAPKGLADIPLIKGFVQRSPTGSTAQSIQDFYESSDQLSAIHNTYRKMRKEGRIEEAKALKVKNPEFRFISSVNKVRSQLSELSKKIDQVIKSDRTDKEKRSLIKLLDARRLALARKVNNLLKVKSNQGAD